ncbi:MAG: hypothetical protein KIS96_14720 [Bauldia sp.]|nr:hypothetical protein [Bauldia sp.]
MISYAAFAESLGADGPPPGVDGPLKGLWLAAKGDWDAAHVVVQDDPSRDAAWVHAHLHRIEGDLDNAAYWYRMAGRPVSRAALDAEREEIAKALTGG